MSHNDTEQTSRWVVVTTDITRRGVFAGELIEQTDDKVVLVNAQMAIYWSAETRGVLGLAVDGPANGSRIGPPVPRIELDGITAVIDMTSKAVASWQAQPWS